MPTARIGNESEQRDRDTPYHHADHDGPAAELDMANPSREQRADERADARRRVEQSDIARTPVVDAQRERREDGLWHAEDHRAEIEGDE